jgi:type IV pilus assembly protein PilO
MALKLELKSLPPVVRVVISVAPAIILLLLVVFLFVMPKQQEIKQLNAKIDEQNNKISVSEFKAARLDFLIRENEKLLERLGELRQYLPEEKEISTLLKEVSDRAIDSGLVMKSWKPGPKKVHPSGFVYEIPVAVAVTGTYHDFGKFLSSLTRLNRIVNIGDIKIGVSKAQTEGTELSISFTASTFSTIPESEMAEQAESAKKKKGRT